MNIQGFSTVSTWLFLYKQLVFSSYDVILGTLRLSQKLSDFNNLMLPSAFHVSRAPQEASWLDVEVSSFEPTEPQTERRLKASK